ncbi:hypothetical protein ACFC0N_22280 [Streptomyces zaomyceticus]|uniref:DUF6928 family protein n=1 Tax=Streptomyces zaomyceticus TaxID=68286 RepID=UPI0035E3420F
MEARWEKRRPVPRRVALLGGSPARGVRPGLERGAVRADLPPPELCNEALRAFFGFLLEGRPALDDVGPDEVPLLGFRLFADSNEPSS